MKRRSFIQKSTLATAGILSTFHYRSFAQNKKLKIGLIGAGWYGLVITKAALKTRETQIVAVCDVDSEHLKNGCDELEKLQGLRPKEFSDYQELLELKDLDIIMIGTMPHWHALQFIAACEKGFDIYCEKPLSYDVREGQAMVAAQKKAGNIVQIGFQRRQSGAFAKTKELIESDKIGKVHQIGAQIHYNPTLADHTIQTPPDSLDWETWCGPAPKLDYRPSIGHNKWRLEKEYGNGHLVDWGIHHIDIIRNIMDFGMPTSFQSNGSLDILKGKITTPDTLNTTMNFEGCPVLWQHRFWGAGDLNPQFNNGIFFYGEKGTLFAADSKIIVQPAGKNQTQQMMDISADDMQDKHVAEFINAVKAKDKNMLSCPIQDAFQSTASVQLAMISYYTNSKVDWDSQNLEILGNKEATKLLARNYHGNYKRPQI